MQRRTPLRSPEFDDASSRPYFVTVCTRDRRCLLGDVCGDLVRLSAIGKVVRSHLEALPCLPGVEVDSFVVMPNHVHAIVGLSKRARRASPLRLGAVVGSFKSGSSRQTGMRLWQRGYYDHVVRDEIDLARVREYIATNPMRWALDPENPEVRP